MVWRLIKHTDKRHARPSIFYWSLLFSQYVFPSVPTTDRPPTRQYATCATALVTRLQGLMGGGGGALLYGFHNVAGSLVPSASSPFRLVLHYVITKCGQILGACSPGRHFVFVGPRCGICLMSIFWRLQFWGCISFLKNMWTQNVNPRLHSILWINRNPDTGCIGELYWKTRSTTDCSARRREGAEEGMEEDNCSTTLWRSVKCLG
jgi:hypothetical protein